ncbi:unnamed protein product, partial [marine sediment metagenome]
GIKFNAWDFFKGKVGKEYSYCNKQGYNISTVDDGKDPFSEEYAVCIPKKSSVSTKSITKVKSVTELMNLKEKILENKNGEIIAKSSNEYAKNKINENRKSSLSSIESAPSEFDWRDEEGYNWLTPVKSQGGCGSCWAFAAVGGVESKIKISRDNPDFNVNLAEQYLVSDCSNAGSCNGGWSSSALSYIKNDGITDEPCFPYTASDSSCSNKCSSWDKRLWKIDNWGYVPTDIETIKEHLINKGPLVAYITMDGYWSNDIYRCVDPSWTNHAVLIVGWDTNEY